MSVERARCAGVGDRRGEGDQIDLLFEARGDALLVVEDEVGLLVQRAAHADVECAGRRLGSGAADGSHPLLLEELRPLPPSISVRTHHEYGRGLGRARGAVRTAPLVAWGRGLGHASRGVGTGALPTAILT